MGRCNEKRSLKLNYDENALLSADYFPEWDNDINDDYEEIIWVSKLENPGVKKLLRIKIKSTYKKCVLF
jgi:hypothetical protein